MRKFITVDDIRLSYVDRPGPGAVLMLIPGSFDGAPQWDQVIRRLSPELRLILVEVRGHGQSWPPPPANGTIELLADDAIRIADAEGLDGFYAGGHSIGGMIAKEMGRRSAQRLAGVISIEGWTHCRVTGALPGNMYGTLTPAQQAQMQHDRQHATGHWTQDQRDAFVQVWRRWGRGDEFMATTEMPVLEIYGDRGRPRPAREQLGVPDRPNIELVWLPGASHDLPRERPAEVADTITTFIRAVPR